MALLMVDLNAHAKVGLDAAGAAEGLNPTQVCNRAIQLYAYLTAIQREGGKLYVQHPDSDNWEQLHLATF